MDSEMDSAPVLLGSSEEQQTSAPFPLADIPSDILMCITDFLPAQSVVALSLAYKGFNSLLKTSKRSKLLSYPEKHAFLHLLTRDAPGTVPCTPCQKLHRPEDMERYCIVTYKGGKVPIKCCVYENLMEYARNLDRLVLAAALGMLLVSSGWDPRDMTHVFDITLSRQMIARGDYIQQTKEQSRFNGDSLIYCRQTVYLSDMHSEKAATFEQLESICSHTNLDPLISNTHSTRRGCCRECQTEFKVEFLPVDGHGLSMFFTIWINLGSAPDTSSPRACNVRELDLRASERIENAIAGGTVMRESGSRDFQLGTLSSAFGNGALRSSPLLSSR